MTHLVVVLVHPGDRFDGPDGGLEGTILRAWLIPHEAAAKLRCKKGKEKYIAVSQLSRENPADGVVDITRLLGSLAETELA
jgi:hypothetical protein